jgi:hypothetical protein
MQLGINAGRAAGEMASIPLLHIGRDLDDGEGEDRTDHVVCVWVEST